MRIGLDVMGGDNAPAAILDGALDALERLDATDELVLVGKESVIKPAIQKRNDPRLRVVHASDTIGMEESPVEAVRGKKDASLTILARMAGHRAEPHVDAMISAGNTGASSALVNKSDA